MIFGTAQAVEGVSVIHAVWRSPWRNVEVSHPEERARASLRTALYSLQKSVPDYLLTTRKSAAFNREKPYWLDVEIFAKAAAADDLATKATAVALMSKTGLNQ